MATPVSGPISMANINSAFGLGYALSAYRGVTWYQPNSLNTGTFSTTNLGLDQFYNKQATDPATSGSIIYTTAGSNNFTVPLYRNSITFEAWGGGGGGGGPAVGAGGSDTSTNGGTSSISVAGYSLSAAGGGKGNIAPGDRSSGASGSGGVGSGGTTNGTGTSGTPYGAYGGRDRPGTSGGGYNGGAGGTTNGLSGQIATGNPGVTPGGGGGPAYFDEDPSNSGKSWSTGGAAGGGGYAAVSFTPSNGPSAGTVLSYTVGAAGTAGGQAGVGGNGQIKITWS
jgi:hypothetical protein